MKGYIKRGLVIFLCASLLMGCGNSASTDTEDAGTSSGVEVTDSQTEQLSETEVESESVKPSETEVESESVKPSETEVESETEKSSEAEKDSQTENDTESESQGPEQNTEETQEPEIGEDKMTTPSNSGALQIIGNKLCDSKGNPVVLRGLSTHGIAWFPDYVNSEAFRDFKEEWGANVIRLAMYTAEYNGYCAGADKEWLKNLIRNGVEYATQNDMYVIVDWHILSDGNPNTYKSEAKEFFKEMSKEFAGHNNVIYEICNEPNGGTSWKDIKAYAKEVIPVIRANDENAIIIVGTPNWCQTIGDAAADPITEYENIMYAVHFYAATHTDWLRNDMVKAINSGLPVFVTEYGICDASGNGAIDKYQADEWVRVMNENGVSYCGWNISNKNETSAIFKASCNKTSGWTKDDLSDCGKWMYEMLRKWNLGE